MVIAATNLAPLEADAAITICPECEDIGSFVDGAGDTRPCECQPTKWDREPEDYPEVSDE